MRAGLVVAILVVAGCTASTPSTTGPAPTSGPASPATRAVTAATIGPTTRPSASVTRTPVVYARLTSAAWSALVKVPEPNIGDTYRIWACITQFDAGTGNDGFRGSASNVPNANWVKDGVNALFQGTALQLSGYVVGDVVALDVSDIGSFAYPTYSGTYVNVPRFEVDQIANAGSCTPKPQAVELLA